jgi:Domain of unknown function (DUF3425)
MPVETPPKKQVSERRRQQNKQAQKNYRKQNREAITYHCSPNNRVWLGDRQRRNLKLLQDIATSGHGFSIGHANKDAQSAELGMDSLRDVHGVYDPSLTRPPLSGYLDLENVENSFDTTDQPSNSILSTVQQHRLFTKSTLPLTPESFDENSVIGHLLEQEDNFLDDETKTQILEGKISLETILKAGLRALSRGGFSETAHSTSYENAEERTSSNAVLRTDKLLVLQNAHNHFTPSLADVRKNHIRMKQVQYVAACIANASSLGVNLTADGCEDMESFFFRENISESAAKNACMSEFEGLRTHLRPCAAQLMHKHHPYIDALPFPTLRERIIKLAYAEELIDEDELCVDLQNDGLVCWGSALGGGSAATGSGAPWDIRSWEAQPWFLKKWWILIGGAEGEIYKQTQWWCEMRGERSCYPW